jgi:hypothetical protein
MKLNLPQCPICRENIQEDLVKWNFKFKEISKNTEIVYLMHHDYLDSDDDDPRPLSPRPTGLSGCFHRMAFGNKRIH